MSTINTTDPKPGFVYNQDDDTWYPLLGLASQTLNSLTDVEITTPTTNQVLAYDGTNWVNSSEAGDISAVTSGTGISVTNGTGPIPSVAVDTAVVATTNNTLTMSAKTLSSSILVGPEERWNVVASAATGTVNIDALTSGVWYYTSNATGNHTLNFRGSSTTSMNTLLSTGDAITLLWMNTNGATPYYPNVYQVDGTASGVTVEWSGGTAPSAGNASAVDIYSFTILKTGSATYTVFAAGAIKYS